MTVDKEHILHFIQSLLDDGSIQPQYINSIITKKTHKNEPEGLRREIENWYRGLGIDIVTKRKLHLSSCPFTKEEIEIANKNNEVILCVPAGLRRQDLGKLFRINCWALEDSLYAERAYKEDFWFRTPIALEPPYIGISAKKARRIFEDEGKLGFSLSRYLVFLSRVKYLTGKWPDQKWWTWLLAYKYDRSGFLIAGLDSEGKLSVHGWMPDFKAKFVGTRYLTVADKG
jgi:hypothetical protein